MAQTIDNRTSGQGFYDHPEVAVCSPTISVYDFSAVTENLGSTDVVKFANLPPNSLVRITTVVTTAENDASNIDWGDGTTVNLFHDALDINALGGTTSPIKRMAVAAPVLTLTCNVAATATAIFYVIVEVWPEPTAPTQP